ncbi:MAG TPA: sigma-70 family RNA polymerase sigma factor [Pirellulaceae bacterium]|nr:sigma-70 family RNA polymerase sigma factor [Pirellulaceae bacterium]
MPPPPETRETLIRRLPNAADVEAWEAFVEIYEPLLFRLARGRGMQPADAEDYVQEVLAAVARNIDRWVASETRGPFRAWLFRIAFNLGVNFVTRPMHQRLGSGDSQIARMLEEVPAVAADSSALFLQEYRRELFRWAAERVREQVSPQQWMVYWLTSVEERPIAEVAKEYGMSLGSVYIARSRITKRIREMIREHEERSQ